MHAITRIPTSSTRLRLRGYPGDVRRRNKPVAISLPFHPWETTIMFKRLCAEFFGTFWLVFGGCGSAVLAAAFPNLGIGFAGVALAFGLTVVTMAYAVG